MLERFNVDDCIEYIGFGRFHLRLTILISLFCIAEALELTFISLLGPFLVKEFKISNTKMAFLSMFFSVGMTVGSLIWGTLADRYGRKKSLLLVSGLCIYMAVVTGMSPTYSWVLIIRTIVGCATGGLMSISTTYFIEMTPTGKRSVMFGVLVILMVVGPLTVVGLAASFYQFYGWRPLGLTIALPLVLGIGLLTTMPQSPRFLALVGDVEGTKLALLKMAKENKVNLEPEEIMVTVKKESRSGRANFMHLFSPELVLLTLSQMFIWFVAGFAQYGAILLITLMPTIPYHCLEDRSKVWTPGATTFYDSSCGKKFDAEYFKVVAVASLGIGIPGFVIIFLGNCLGRKWIICLFCAVGAISFIVVDFCMPDSFRQLVFILIRASTKGMYVTLFMYTAEVYPTFVRGTAVGLCAAMSRIGSVLTPFAAQVLLEKVDILVTLFLYALLLFMSSLIALSMPYETVSLGLVQDIDEGVANANAVEESHSTYGSIQSSRCNSEEELGRAKIRHDWDSRRGSIGYRRLSSLRTG